MANEEDGPGKAPTIAQLCAERRKRLPDEIKNSLSARPWGLALSGGGIRSATFCFGLIKALAKNKILHKFDILSTVSGGGYIGSTLGKLYQSSQGQTPDPLIVEQGVADADTRWFAAWLRANGRYLIPKGAKDILFAAANFGRNLIGVHVELAFLSLLLGGVLVGLDLAVWQWADCVYTHGQCWHPQWDVIGQLGILSHWPTAWILLVPLAWGSSVLACAYWAMPTRSDQSIGLQRSATALMAVLGTVILVRHSTHALDGIMPRYTGDLVLPGLLVVGLIAFCAAWFFGVVVAAVFSLATGKDLDRARNRLTAGLSLMLRFTLLVMGLGIVDYLAWSLGNLDEALQGNFGVILGLIVIALRGALPKIADLPKSLVPATRSVVFGVINIIGLTILVLVVIFWMSFVHRATSSVLFSDPLSLPGLNFSRAWQCLAWLFVVPLLLVLVSTRNREFLNRSSLYTFYRARLVRSYLGAANAQRFKATPQDPTDCLSPARDQRTLTAVTDVQADDDIAMSDYQPHLAGGPVHLINVCINQTQDPKGGLFNQDRKGLPLTVGPNAQVSIAKDQWYTCAPQAALSLGSWMAISGAAVAPGLGSSTRSGISALLMMAGIRLGYWWDSINLASDIKGGKRTVGKYGQFLSELRGRFNGDRRRDWFLSDGGHFENTGAYALLREECELIIVADCGADPRFSFGDLENLVRKARIDLQADITFLRPWKPDPNLPSTFGSLNELASPDSEACLAMARIDYRHSNTTGHMLIVKPNMCHGAPADLVNFKADHPLFPQEPTTDQFFSEAQWESYFQLGQTLGKNISLKELADGKKFANNYFVDDDGAIMVKDSAGKKSLQFSSKRLSSRIASTGAVSASISLGAVASIGLAGWQALNKEFDHPSPSERIEPAIKELSQLFGTLSPAAAQADVALGRMATELLRIGKEACDSDNVEAFTNSKLMKLMIDTTKEACSTSSTPHASCAELLKDDDAAFSPCLQTSPRSVCIHMYWTRDYATTPLQAPNCLAATQISVAAEPRISTSPDATGPTENTATPVAVPAQLPSQAETSLPTPGPVCDGQTIYLQIYGPELRDAARLLREPWRLLGASVPSIEDVVDTARRAGRRPPQAYSVPTVIFHHQDSSACAAALLPRDAAPAWQIQPLSSGLTGQRGVIEVWLPPAIQTAEAQPDKAYCYQEDDRVAGPRRFGVHCHTTIEACQTARGDNRKRTQSACEQTDLTQAGSVTFSRGWAHSWYSLQAKPYGRPFPALAPSAGSASPQ